MEAIDYNKLLREERKRAKQKKKERELLKAVKVPLDTKKKEKEDSVDGSADKDEKKADAQYCWEYPDGFLGFGELTLKSICEDPRSISYSSMVLEKRAPETPNTNENESVTVTNESNDSESCVVVPTRIGNNIMKPVSPGKALVNWLQNLPSGNSGLGEWKVMSYGKRRVCMFGEEETDDGLLPPPLAEIARELVKLNVFPPSSSCPPPNHVLLNEYQPGQGILPHTDGPLYEHRTATLSLGSDVVIEFTKRLASNEIGTSAKQTTTTTIVMDSNLGDDHRERKQANSNHRTGKDNTDNNNNSRRLDTGNDQLSSSAPIQVLLESGSLLVFQEDAYMNYCHGIAMDVWRDVTTDHCLNAPSGKIVHRGLRYSLTFRHKKTEMKQLQ
jgi:hypothetical protein